MKIPTPRWYDNLNKKMKNIVDQIAHTAIGFLLGLAEDGVISASTLYGYEFFLQWPIDRPRDTRMDMGFWLGGTVLGVTVRRIFL